MLCNRVLQANLSLMNLGDELRHCACHLRSLAAVGSRQSAVQRKCAAVRNNRYQAAPAALYSARQIIPMRAVYAALTSRFKSLSESDAVRDKERCG